MSDYHRSSTRKRGRFIALAVGALLLAVVGIVVSAAINDDSGVEAQRPILRPTATPSSRPVDSGCNSSPASDATPAKGPSAEWVLVSKFAQPRSDVYGPTSRKGGVGSCFAHSPIGALFAAANYVGDSKSPALNKRQFAARFFEDKNKRLAVAALQEQTGGSANDLPLQINAFRINDYSSDRASVELAFRATEGPHTDQLASLSLVLGWQNSDWRIIVPASGRPPSSVLASLAGYTKWGGA